MTDGPRVLIVEARFYEEIADELVRGAVAVLDEAAVAYRRIDVPGAFEIPAVIRMVCDSGRYDAYVALGCVIRGETTHYDYVCQESARGLQDLAAHRGVALGYGILTCENREQAWARAAVTQGNKGAGAARAALRMYEIGRELGFASR